MNYSKRKFKKLLIHWDSVLALLPQQERSGYENSDLIDDDNKFYGWVQTEFPSKILFRIILTEKSKIYDE